MKKKGKKNKKGLETHVCEIERERGERERGSEKEGKKKRERDGGLMREARE